VEDVVADDDERLDKNFSSLLTADLEAEGGPLYDSIIKAIDDKEEVNKLNDEDDKEIPHRCCCCN
jgi:hypothetical protein